MLEEANGTYINLDENQATRNVESAFAKDEYKDDYKDYEPGWPCKWNQCQVETPILEKVDRVYFLGMIL